MFVQHPAMSNLTTQSSGTSVKLLVSNFTSGASAPYFGCQVHFRIMQNLYEPPNSKFKVEESRRSSIAIIFLAANSGFLTIPALVFSFFYFTGSVGYFSITQTLIFSAACSLPVSILIVLFRRIRWYWAAIAGSALSTLLGLAITLFDELQLRT